VIDETILDEILPVPDIEELREEKIAELQEEGFAITNYHSGGIFYTIMMILLRIKVELVELLRTVLSQMTISSAIGGWLDLKACDYSKVRKEAQKTRGKVTLSRGEGGEAVKVPLGHIFKTSKDINGEQLRYYVLEETVLQKGVLSVDVPVEAEIAGSRYNVPKGQITETLTYIAGIDTITNGKSWLTLEGSDIEDDESFRARILRSWADLAQRPVAETYQNAAESVQGVLCARVEDQLPRGQGTIDVIVTGTAGTATGTTLAAVVSAIADIIGPCDDVLVKSSETVTQDVAVTITISTTASAEDAVAQATTAITNLFTIRTDQTLNELVHADVIHAVKSAAPAAKNVKVTVPESDMYLDVNKVILLGALNITVERM